MTTGVVHFFDADRLMSSAGGTDGGTVYFYYTGTTNLAPIYADIALTIPLTNPVSVAVGQILPHIYLDPLITYRRRIVHTYDGAVFDVDPINSAPSASASTFKNDKTNSVTRTVASALSEKVSILDYIPVQYHDAMKNGTSTVDIVPYLNTLINDYAPYSGVSWTGVVVEFPKGKFAVGSGGIDLTGKHGVWLEGRGDRQTVLFALGDHPVVKDTGGATTTSGIAVQGFEIRGYGNGSTAGDGINLDGTNRPLLRDLYFFSCRRAVSSKNIWEGNAHNIHSFGGGADRSSYGWYQDLSYLIGGYLSNAWNVSSSTFYDSLVTDFRVINPQGSTYSDIRTGGSPLPGHIGNPGSTILVQWFHMVNCLFDTATTGPCLKIEKVAATELSQMHLSNIWVGNSPAEHIVMDGCTDLMIGGIMAISATKEAVRMTNCTRCVVGPVLSRGTNGGNAGYGAIKLENSTTCMIGPVRDYPANSAPSVVETGTADNNLLFAIANSATLVGPSSMVSASLGSNVFEYRNAGDAVGAIVAGNTAYLGFGTTANKLLHNIQRTTTGGIEVYTNSGRRFRFGNGSGATEFLNTSDQPLNLPGSTLAGAPASPAGSIWYITNGRKGGEGAGLGTGVLAYRSGTTWYRCSDDTAVVV